LQCGAFVAQVSNECWQSGVIGIFQRLSMAAFEFQTLEYTRVTGGHLKSCLLIPSKHTRTINGVLFVHLSSVPNFAQALFNERAKVGSHSRSLQKTDIALQLLNLRNTSFAAVRDALKPKRTVVYGEGQPANPSRWVTRHSHVVPSYPEYTMIDAPSIGDVEGRTIKTICPGHRGLNAPLFIECTDENITYVRDACRYQITHGSIKRHQHPKRKRDIRNHSTSRIEPSWASDTVQELEPHVVQSASGASDDDDAGIGSSSPAASCASSAHADIEETSSPMSVETPPKRQSVRTGAITDFFGARRTPIQG